MRAGACSPTQDQAAAICVERRRMAIRDLHPACPAGDGPLKKRITAVDTIPKATRTPVPIPIRAHPSECLLLLRGRKKTASRTCV